MQAASGAGQAAMDELELQTREVLEGKPPTTNIFPFQVPLFASDVVAGSRRPASASALAHRLETDHTAVSVALRHLQQAPVLSSCRKKVEKFGMALDAKLGSYGLHVMPSGPIYAMLSLQQVVADHVGGLSRNLWEEVCGWCAAV